MNQLNKKQLIEIEGGGFSIGAMLTIGGIITFIIGVIDGYVRPLKCNK